MERIALGQLFFRMCGYLEVVLHMEFVSMGPIAFVIKGFLKSYAIGMSFLRHL